MARVLWRTFGAVLRRLVRRFNSKEAAGGYLAAIALGTVHPPAGHYYAAVRRDVLRWLEPSELVRSDEARDALDSAPLVGLDSGASAPQ